MKTLRILLLALVPLLAIGQPPPTLWKRVPGGIAPKKAGDNVVVGTTVLTSAGLLPKFDWCVDSANGDDGQDGKCDETGSRPLKTIAALLQQTIAAGQTIGLARGSVWREQLTVPVGNVTVAAYGWGARPLLDASDQVAAVAWSKTGGQSLVYQATVPLDAVDPAQWVGAWENGTRLSRAASIAACDATAGSYFPSSDNTATITLYVHLAGGGDPAVKANGWIEYTRRKYGLFVANKPAVVVDGVWTRRNLHNDGSLSVTGAGVIVRNSLASDGGKHNIYAAPNSSWINVEGRDGYQAGGGFYVFVFNGNGQVGDILIQNCWMHNTTYDSSGAGFGGHSNDGQPFTGTITYLNSKVENLGSGFAGTDYNHGVCTNCVTSGVNQAVNDLSRVDFTISGGNLSAITNAVANGSPANAGAVVTIANATLTTTSGSTGNTIYLDVPSLSVTRSTITTGWGGMYLPHATPMTSFVNTGNTFVHPLNSQQAYLNLASVPAVITSDNNSYKYVLEWPGDRCFYFGSAHYTWAQWQALGYDAASNPAP